MINPDHMYTGKQPEITSPCMGAVMSVKIKRIKKNIKYCPSTSHVAFDSLQLCPVVAGPHNYGGK